MIYKMGFPTGTDFEQATRQTIEACKAAAAKQSYTPVGDGPVKVERIETEAHRLAGEYLVMVEIPMRAANGANA